MFFNKEALPVKTEQQKLMSFQKRLAEVGLKMGGHACRGPQIPKSDQKWGRGKMELFTCRHIKKIGYARIFLY